MHIPDRMAVLRRMVSWLAPGGWLVAEEADFGMWLADFDPVWAAHPAAWHEAFPNGSLSQGRALLRQIHRLGLSVAATAQPLISAGLLTSAEAARFTARLDEPDFMGCGFTHIGVWGRRTGDSYAWSARHTSGSVRRTL